MYRLFSKNTFLTLQCQHCEHEIIESKAKLDHNSLVHCPYCDGKFDYEKKFMKELKILLKQQLSKEAILLH